MSDKSEGTWRSRWLHVISCQMWDDFQSRQTARSLSGRTLFGIIRQLSTLKARSIRVSLNQGTAIKYCVLLFVMGNIWISHTQFVYDKRARDCKCLLVFVFPAKDNARKKVHFYKLTFTFKHHQLMWKYLAWSLKAKVNILVSQRKLASSRNFWTTNRPSSVIQ